MVKLVFGMTKTPVRQEELFPLVVMEMGEIKIVIDEFVESKLKSVS
jgi:hypothetical protein